MEFTPTEKRILEVLADGLPHYRKDLVPLLQDDQATEKNLQFHISNMRKVLRPAGQDILCEFSKRRKYYRHIKLLNGIATHCAQT